MTDRSGCHASVLDGCQHGFGLERLTEKVPKHTRGSREETTTACSASQQRDRVSVCVREYVRNRPPVTETTHVETRALKKAHIYHRADPRESHGESVRMCPRRSRPFPAQHAPSSMKYTTGSAWPHGPLTKAMSGGHAPSRLPQQSFEKGNIGRMPGIEEGAFWQRGGQNAAD
jgi:hypothetical protein